MADALASILNPVASATGTAPSQSAGVTLKTTNDAATMAKNFDSFLTLLTTQLKNQNPLEPLDTNQFTQQLVQFTQVEQQMKMNTQLASLISIEQMAQSTAAMAYLGSTATVDGSTAKLESGKASWTFASDKPSSATINIKNSTGALVYSGNYTVNAGQQNFQWDGRGNNGTKYPGRQLHACDLGQGYHRPERGDLDPGVRHGRQRRPEREPADALDRRAELHHGQDQEGRAPGPVGRSSLATLGASGSFASASSVAPFTSSGSSPGASICATTDFGGWADANPKKKRPLARACGLGRAHRLAERERDDAAPVLLGGGQADRAEAAFGDHENVVRGSDLVVLKLAHGPEIHFQRGHARNLDGGRLRQVHAVFVGGLSGAGGAGLSGKRAALQPGSARRVRNRDDADTVRDHDRCNPFQRRN